VSAAGFYISAYRDAKIRLFRELCIGSGGDWRKIFERAPLSKARTRSFVTHATTDARCVRSVFFNRGSTEPQVSASVVRGFGETDQNGLGRNSRTQSYAVVAISTLGSLHRVP